MTDPPAPCGAPVPPASSWNLRTAWRTVRVLLYLTLAGAVGAVAYASFQAAQDKRVMRHSHDRIVNQIGLTPLAIRHLAPKYTDKHDRLLADAPSDPKELLNPDPLVLAFDEDADAETQTVDWNAFQKHLAKATGKKIVAKEFRNRVEDIESVADGKSQIVALHAADAPFLVNNAGFIPVAVLAGESGANGNHLDLVVPANSKITTLAELQGHTLTCSTPLSITGYRAAVAVLQEETGMRPDVDYFINFSLSQKRSVLGVSEGEFEAAALSDDKVQSLLKKGKIKPSEYHVIYQSQVIPRLTIGTVYNLEPELAAKVQQAILDFDNAGGAAEESAASRCTSSRSTIRKISISSARSTAHSIRAWAASHRNRSRAIPRFPPPPRRQKIDMRRRPLYRRQRHVVIRHPPPRVVDRHARAAGSDGRL